MDVKSVATLASADGLVPATHIKYVLSQYFPTLPQAVNTSSPLFSQDLGRALLNESIVYLLRSMSHLVSYEAIYIKHQFSWALVTLYYANYFCALSLNRLAGNAISTANNRHYEVNIGSVQSNFLVKRISVNNHQSVWETNALLYADFNWRDSTYDGTLVKVIKQEHLERKIREITNYHPDSYKELLKSKHNGKFVSYFGKNYLTSPNTVLLLPFSDDLEKNVATLECRAVGRQIITLTILGEIRKLLQPSSKALLVDYFASFSKNMSSRSPFNSKLKQLFISLLQNCLYE